jgi:hypothetical protein
VPVHSVPRSLVQPWRAIFLDVEQRTQWRGGRDTTRRRLWRLLALSALLHVPLTPVFALAGLLGLLSRPAPTPEVPDLGQIHAIPIDLLEPGPEPAAEPNSPPADQKQEGSHADKGKDGAKAELDTPERLAAQPKASPATSGTAARGGAIGDPVSMSGAAGRVTDANANVRVLIFTDRIRNHPLGDRIGELLGTAQQWQDFFGPAGLDPIHDVDRILIAGPQFKDSSGVIAVLRTNVPQERVRSAIDKLVKRSDGEWIDGPVPVAHAKADRAERAFVMASPNIVVVTPPSAEKHAISVGPSLRFPNPSGKEALTTYVITPWRAFVGIPFKVPQSIKWVRMKVIAGSDGGASAEIEAEDENADLAGQHAEELTKNINAVTQIKLGFVGALIGKKEARLIEPVSFSARGSHIFGTVTATPKQLATLLEAVAGYAKELAAEAERKAKAEAAKGDAGAPAADAGAAPSAPAPREPAVPNAPDRSDAAAFRDE